MVNVLKFASAFILLIMALLVSDKGLAENNKNKDN